MPRLLAGGLVVVAGLLTSGCGAARDAATGDRPGELHGTVTVLAASSLTAAFEDIAQAFEAVHDGVEVTLSFDGSSGLATQLLEGAPADVFASADQRNLQKVVDGGLAQAGETFATNVLQIVVPTGNPAGVESLDDLLRPDIIVALCAPEVPCGRYAEEAFGRAGLAVPTASQEENVRGVVTKIALGEADAGIVYVTDVLAATGVAGVDLPIEHQVPARYPATVLDDAPNPEAAAAFLAFLTGTEAQDILAEHGFGAP